MAGGPLVLLLEDEYLIASVTSEFLRDRGFAVVTAGTPAEAISVLDGLDERLSGLILDIHLGDGATGFEVARVARQRFPNVAVLYASGLRDPVNDHEHVPGSRFIGKPYNSDEVADILAVMTAPSSRN